MESCSDSAFSPADSNVGSCDDSYGYGPKSRGSPTVEDAPGDSPDDMNSGETSESSTEPEIQKTKPILRYVILGCQNFCTGQALKIVHIICRSLKSAKDPFSK